MIVGLGIDVVQVSRIARAMRSERFLSRILTHHEQGLDLTPMRVASRWAAKEAIYKALGGGITWHDLSVMSDSARAPWVIWHRPCLPEGHVLHLSLSHERNVAVAVAILESDAFGTLVAPGARGPA